MATIRREWFKDTLRASMVPAAAPLTLIARARSKQILRGHAPRIDE